MSIVIAVPRAEPSDSVGIVVLEAHRAAPADDRTACRPLQCDVSAIIAADASTLDAIARLQLIARRLGTSIELTNAAQAVIDVLDLAGLAGVIPNAGSGVEVDRQVEEREQLRVDEEVDAGDAAV